MGRVHRVVVCVQYRVSYEEKGDTLGVWVQWWVEASSSPPICILWIRVWWRGGLLVRGEFACPDRALPFHFFLYKTRKRREMKAVNGEDLSTERPRGRASLHGRGATRIVLEPLEPPSRSFYFCPMCMGICVYKQTTKQDGCVVARDVYKRKTQKRKPNDRKKRRARRCLGFVFLLHFSLGADWGRWAGTHYPERGVKPARPPTHKQTNEQSLYKHGCYSNVSFHASAATTF